MQFKRTNRFVFVGQFPYGFLDERELFGGNVDAQSVMRVNPVIQCTYDAGKYHFGTTPDRIELRASEDEVISDTLADAARTVIGRIDQFRHFVTV